jgi:hypothetical protein
MKHRFNNSYGLLTAIAVVIAASTVSAADFDTIAKGLELACFDLANESKKVDTSAVILRVDPAQWDFRVVSMSQTGEKNGLTAKQWCEKYGLTAAINAGMFQEDMVTHVGYMKSGSHVNSRLRNKYLSAAAFAARREGLPVFRLADLDVESIDSLIVGYDCAIQNLRLIKYPGENVWSENPRRWSEAALAEDSAGRALFVFCRKQLSMPEFNRWLLSLGLGVIRAQHLEGGSEAQIYVHTNELELELTGAYETSFMEGEDSALPAAIPFVIGVVPKPQRSGR